MEVGGLETLEFPVDILGSEVFGSTIFVRDAYTHLFNIIAWNDTAISTGTPNKRSYIITGTPGIGKSFFGFYLIYRLAREFPDHNIEWQDNAVRVILFADGGINYQQSGYSIISVNSHGEGAFITNFTHCNTFYIADAIEPIAGRTRRFVLVTSPKRDRYKELAKAPNVYKLGMPIWDELELERLWKLRFPSITESDWRGYFSKWDGVPRSILEKTNSFYQEDLYNNCQAVDIDACMKWIGTNRYNSTSISGTVLHMTVTPEGKYEDFRVKFASLYIENIIVSYYERNMPKMITKYILDTEEDSVYASTRGYIFEAIAHWILARGGKFQVRRLGDLTEETIALPKLVQQSFYSVDEIKPGFYSRPRSRTFETIDSLCIYRVAEHDSLFQITVGRQHSIKVNGLENLSGKLMGKVRFYFVVPGDVYPRFINPQNYLNSAGQKHQRIPRWITEKVEQWVLKLDYSAF
ncbi:hypothetical protein L211DRAFT_668245 [Terfezia boudieri ATCC MYA-4762]|uniref:Crinkler family protein n=1 Tax=Terfezia boudieri ATCC MYA-4762 TaxID=1051890 RepID=A0A3N4LED3_9PEZI|nr:hypothetical protein L211DRAFT_668245 [Terfezia boudieri ATCC MYA-4762]